MYGNEILKNKMKSNNNKFPLPKLKYSNFNNQAQIKTKYSNNQPQVNYYNNHKLDQYNIIQQNSYQPKEPKEEHIFNSKTNIKIKSSDQKNINNNNRANSGKFKINKNNNNNYQTNLNYLLREFGLSEYIKDLNELGYDNNNYLKIGTLSKKNFNNLLNVMGVLPDKYIKMEKFYEYLQKLNMSSHNNYYNNINNNNTIYKKRKLNYNSIYGLNNGNKPSPSNNYNHYYNYDNYNINKPTLKINNNHKIKKSQSPRNRPKTSNINNGFSKTKIKIRNDYSGNRLKRTKDNYNSRINSPYLINGSEEKTNNNKSLIETYVNGNHKFKINNNSNNNNQNYLYLRNKYNENNNNNINLINNNNNQDVLYNYYNNYNKNKEKELEDKINENIERMLNYYMVQLNDKLDKSYETVEDSSLSCIITSQINESQNIAKKNNENKITPNYKLPSINNFNSLNNKKINKKNDNNFNNKENNKLRSKYNENKNINDINKEKEKENKKEIEKKIEDKKEDKKENKTKNIKEKDIKNNDNEIIKKENESKEDKKEIIKEIKEEELKNKLKEDNSRETLKKFSDPEISTKSKESREHEIEEEEFLLKGKKQMQTQTPNINSESKEKMKGEEKKETNKINPKDLLLDDSNYISNKYSLEQNIFENLRLNKSMDADNINKDTLKFDIEFMCRCLGLALMKLIEQGKEKQHLTELYTSNENQDLKFKFFNTEFNKNLNMIKDFFNVKSGNNEKLGDSNMISILEKYCLENNDIDNDDIDMMKHIKKNGDEKIIQNVDIQEESFKLRTGLADIENEIKFLGDFFSYGRKKPKNYQNLSENTQKILCKELSYIKEIDSELNKTGSVMNSNIENNNSGINMSKSNSNIKKIKNNSEYNFSKEDSKNNIENKTKILNEDEKDEDYNYEDEFLNDNNFLDDKSEDKEEEEKNKEDSKEEEDEKEEDEKNKEDSKEEEEKNKKEDKKDNKEDSIDNKEDDKSDKNDEDEKDKIDNNKKNDEELFDKNEIKGEFKNERIIEELNKKKNEDKKEEKEDEKEVEKNKISERDKNIKKDEKLNDIETNYIIDIDNINKFKEYLLKKFEVFDDDFLYYSMNIPLKRFMPPPDPQSIFEFCANIMILTKMEKEVIIISLIYIERLIFNTGFIINSRNWRKIIFIALIIASKIWDDDSLENIHYSQVFTHLRIGEINLLERTFLELINYKVFIKFSEYMKYYLSIKNLALRYNFNGEKIVPVSVEKMMKIQEYAYQMQKRMRKKSSLNNSAQF